MAVNIIYQLGHACGQYVVCSCLDHFKTLSCIFLACTREATWPSGHLAIKFLIVAAPQLPPNSPTDLTIFRHLKDTTDML